MNKKRKEIAGRGQFSQARKQRMAKNIERPCLQGGGLGDGGVGREETAMDN